MHTTETARYHLPGLFEFFEFYRRFLPLFYEHRDWFYPWCDIASIYGAPSDCIWGGGRIENNDEKYGRRQIEKVRDFMARYGISARLAFSNSLLQKEHLSDRKCNDLCALFSEGEGGRCDRTLQNGIIVHSDLLLDYLKERYPAFYFVSSTTKVITDFDEFTSELNRNDFRYVVPDFRLNKLFERLDYLIPDQKNKVEFLCNECCWTGCTERKICYETVSRQILGEDCTHICTAPDGKRGYRFSEAMKNPSFISIGDIQNFYLPHGFSNFKIEGRSLGSALLLEFLLYYLTRPEYHIHVREELYLDNTLDLF